MSNKFVRIVAIVLAALMACGVFAAALQVFAASPETAVAAAATGQRSYWPVLIALLAAVVLIALCVIIPKVSKKK